MQQYLLIIMCILLCSTGCSSLTPVSLYELKPMQSTSQHHKQIHQYRIGIQELKIPGYLDKPQLSIFSNLHQLKLYENHEWAERLQANTADVLMNNLAFILPQNWIQLAPYSANFRPNCEIYVHILSWEALPFNYYRLNARYAIQSKHDTVVYYFSTQTVAQDIEPLLLVNTMNEELNQLSQDIAQHLQQL